MQLLNDEDKQHLPFTTIHQCSKICWVFMHDLLNNIKNSYESLKKRLFNESEQFHRLEKNQY